MNSGSQREIDSLKHRMQESTTDAEAATAKLSALTAERESDPMASRDARARWMASPATRDPHQPLPLNDAPCPPFTSHGASILLAPATRDPHQPLPLRPPPPNAICGRGETAPPFVRSGGGERKLPDRATGEGGGVDVRER
jgi:hypothetical protein